MKDKRLEVKLSVRGDGSLTRNGTRNSARSNRSNASNSGLPRSEIFATDRYSTPYHRSFEILDKYRRQPNQEGYPAQSLQALNQYEQQPMRYRDNPYIDYNEPPRAPQQYPVDQRNQPRYYPQQYTLDQIELPGSPYQQYRPQSGYQPVYNDPIRFHGTLPRSNHHNQQRSPYETNHYTLPARSGPRRVRISDLQPTVHGYGESVSERAESEARVVSDQRCIEVRIARAAGGLGLSIAGGRGSTPYIGSDDGIFISRVTPNGPAYLAGLRVGDKVLSVNGTSVIEVDHYYAVEVLKASGSTLHLVVTRESPNSTRTHSRAASGASHHSVSSTIDTVSTLENGQIPTGRGIASAISARPLIIGNQYAQEYEPEQKDPSPINTSVSFGQSPAPAQVPGDYQRLQASPPPTTAPYVPPVYQQKVLVHTTLIRDGAGLGFSIAGGKGSPPYREDSDAIYISRISPQGAASKDGKMLVGDKVVSINGVDMELAPHETAVSMLTGHERFVRLVLQRTITSDQGEIPPRPKSTSEEVREHKSSLQNVNAPKIVTNSHTLPNRAHETTDTNDRVRSAPVVTTPVVTTPVVTTPVTPTQVMAAPKSTHVTAVPPQPAPRKLSQTNGQANTKPSTPLTPGANHTHGSTDDVFEDIQPSRPITNAEFQAMIPAHFLGGARPPAEPPSSGVRVTVERPANHGVVLPPPPSALGRVTETITKSTFTETTVTRTTDNHLAEPLIAEEVTLLKEGGSLGFSIIGGTDHSCVPFGGKEPGIFVSHVVPGGVAARSGKLRMGDRLIKVNGHELHGASHRDAVQLLLMPGPTLSLTVRHDPLPLGFQDLTIVKQEGEKLGMHIKGGLNGQRGNPNEPNDEGVFISKINSGGSARRDGRLKVGMRLLEVNGVSLLGATHNEAVNALRAATNAPLHLVVCYGYTRPEKYTTGSESGTADTGGSLSHSTSSLDRDEPLHQQQEHHVQQDLVEFEHEKQVAELREKSTPEKVLDIVHAVEHMAMEPAPQSPELHHKTTTVVMSKHTLQPQSSSSPAPANRARHPSASALAPAPAPSPPHSPQRPLHPPPPPPKQRPQVPRKPQTKRVSFTTDEPEPSRYEPYQHGEHGEPPTNDACEGVGSILIRNRTPATDLEMSRPVIKPSRVLPAELILPPPPLFDTDVSDAAFVDEGENAIIGPPITVVPERTLLPESVVAETSMQSVSSDATEADPPPVNYEAYPERPLIIAPHNATVLSEVPPRQVFRQKIPSTDYIHELSVSPSGEPDPPALLHAQYGVLPSVSHVPNSPCHLHPDQTYFEDVQPLHTSLRDLRAVNLSPGMVHSKTYPPVNPYPSLTTVAGTYNPYTCLVPSANQSYHGRNTPPPISISTVDRDINANVAPISYDSNENPLKIVQSERRVRFGEVTMAPEPDSLSNSSEPREETFASDVHKPWRSKVKAFAIGEASPPHSGNFVKASVSDKKKFFENAMEESHKPSPKPEKVFTFLSADEVEKLKQEEERKMASLSRSELSWSPEDHSGYSSHSDEEPYENGHSVSGGVSPSAKSRRRAGAEHEDPAARAARRAAWRAARLRSLEQEAIESQKVIKSMGGPANNILEDVPPRGHSPSEVETTQEKIISLELTTSPSSETAPDLEVSLGEGEGEGEAEDSSLQPDIVQVVNPLLDGGAGRVTSISVGPAQKLTAYSEQL